MTQISSVKETHYGLVNNFHHQAIVLDENIIYLFMYSVFKTYRKRVLQVKISSSNLLKSTGIPAET